LSSLCNHSSFTAKKIIKNFKIESPLNWNTIAQNFDLIPAGHQIGEAELLFAKLKTKKLKTNRQTRSN
jgi:methionyl-tRNA synthetase